MRNLIPHFVYNRFEQEAHSGAFQAATLFVDISGFTPLTETLMQHHKDGAEVLSETLDGIFSPLVSQVYARGGLIPLFAGDAFTALFPHDPVARPDAPLHALQTAFFIQDFFTPRGRDRAFRTKYGDFAVGAKVGLSYGTVRWGIPGQAGRFSFYFRGEAVDGCAQAEGLAAKGQIVADDRLMPYIHQHVGSQPLATPAYHRLTACSLDLPAPGASLPPFSRADLAPFMPDAVLDLAAKAEFREVCPVFLSFEEPVEEAPLHEFLAAVMTLADRYGGTFSQIDFGDMGGIVVLWFGAPRSYEDNVQRAAEFLLACRGQDWPLRWRAGLAFGTVWAGIRGGHERCEYGLIGDVVNLACRLVLKAEWGEVWASPAARERLQDAYDLEARGTFQLKGKRGEIPVYQLQGRTERAEAVFHTGPMVGREAELDRLAVYVQPIFTGRFAGLVYVHGEAGVGKSRLVYALQQRLAEQGVRWFLCPADQILRQSLNPFRRSLRRYFDQSRERRAEQNQSRFDAVLDALIADLQAADAPHEISAWELADELERTRSFLGAPVDLRWAGSLYEQLDPKLRLENTLAAFKTLMLAESLRQPVVLQLEDLHWLDADSPRLVKLLTRNVEAYPFAVICTSRYRDDGRRVELAVDPDVPQQGMELGTLAPEGVRALAAQMLDGEIADELAAFLTARTEGNPFFVEQLVLDLRERGAVLSVAGGQWLVSGEGLAELPTTIMAVLIARLDRLVAQVREVVQTAAVLGREFEVHVLSHMLRGEEGVLIRVKQAEAERIWTALSEVRYIFRHALLRDAAYDMQLRARLRELHSLAGEAIEQVYAADLAPHYADLAYHYGRAEDVAQERHYAKLAGEQAATQYANAEAVRHFSRALELAPEDDLAGRYALRLAREAVYELVGARELQAHDLEALEALAEALDDRQKRARVALRRSRYAQATGDFPGAIAAAQQSIALALDDADRAEGYLAWGNTVTRQGQYDVARSQLEQAMALAREAGPQAQLRGLEAASLRALGLVCYHLADYAQARGHMEQVVRIHRQTGDLRGEGQGLNSLGVVLYNLGDSAGASGCYEQALRVRRVIGDRRGEGATLTNLGLVSLEQGEPAKAVAYYEQGLRIQRQIDDRHGEVITLANLGSVAWTQADYAGAREYWEQALAIYGGIGDRRGEGMMLSNLGLLSQNLGDYAGARDYFEQSLAIRRQIGDPRGESCTLAELGLLAHRLGDEEAAREYCQQALLIAQAIRHLWCESMALAYLGHALTGLGQLDEASRAYRDALTIQRELGRHNPAMESLAGLARVCLVQGQPSLAQAHVEEILAHLETGDLDGTAEPFRVYLTCYQVLCAAQDPRAWDILNTAHSLLQEQAAKIGDEELQRSFLEDVAAHREIVAAFRSTQAGQ
jgi:predicted ATPase/class 3 adenylate cyclase